MKRARNLALVAEIPQQPTTMNEKLEAAIKYLGKRYRLHPEHDPELIKGAVLYDWLVSRGRKA